jgi:2-polyprenyl-3-methyl-5-hydroxy-6-metoxy-1,4-benzoquinol methylase
MHGTRLAHLIVPPQIRAGVPPGSALEIGMGQGRNTIAIARLGWKVTGIDISDEGIRQAEAKRESEM